MARHSFHAIQPVTDQRHDADQIEDRGAQRPWLTTEEVADRLRYTGKSRLRSVYRFLKVKGIPIRRRGVRSILVATRDVDRALDTARRR